MEFKTGDKVKYYADDALFIVYGQIKRVIPERYVVVLESGKVVRAKKSQLNWN